MMKKLIGLVAMAIFLFSVFSIAEAKPYKPLSIPGGYTAEIPDDAVLPSYLSRLVADSTTVVGKIIVDDCVVLRINYLDPDFRYIDKDGTEIYACLEYVKLEANDAVRLIGVSFITDDGEIILYADEKAFKGPVTNTLTKVKSDSGIKKIPREKQSPG